MSSFGRMVGRSAAVLVVLSLLLGSFSIRSPWSELLLLGLIAGGWVAGYHARGVS